MPPKRAPKAPPAPARSPAKKAPRPATTKKKQAVPKPAAAKGSQPEAQKPLHWRITQQLYSLLQDPSVSARSVVDFVVGPTCGLESLHDWSNRRSITPFLLAIAYNRLDVAQLLVAEHSANTKAAAESNCTALHIASEFGYLELARYLVEQCGLDVEAVDVHGQSCFHWAIIYKHSDMALLLLELGADPHRTGSCEQTSLSFACYYGLMDVARALIAKGANIDAVDTVGGTPLYSAIMRKHSDVALLLLELGADPHYTDFCKGTPLHYACREGMVDVARVLIGKGASQDAVNFEGKTPLDIALASQHSELVSLFGATRP